MNLGQTLAHYEIIRPLGKGGTDEVYLAQDLSEIHSVLEQIVEADRPVVVVASDIDNLYRGRLSRRRANHRGRRLKS
jgi:serine/threonine protein kinase